MELISITLIATCAILFFSRLWNGWVSRTIDSADKLKAQMFCKTITGEDFKKLLEMLDSPWREGGPGDDTRTWDERYKDSLPKLMSKIKEKNLQGNIVFQENAPDLKVRYEIPSFSPSPNISTLEFKNLRVSGDFEASIYCGNKYKYAYDDWSGFFPGILIFSNVRFEGNHSRLTLFQRSCFLDCRAKNLTLDVGIGHGRAAGRPDILILSGNKIGRLSLGDKPDSANARTAYTQNNPQIGPIALSAKLFSNQISEMRCAFDFIDFKTLELRGGNRMGDLAILGQPEGGNGLLTIGDAFAQQLGMKKYPDIHISDEENFEGWRSSLSERKNFFLWRKRKAQEIGDTFGERLAAEHERKASIILRNTLEARLIDRFFFSTSITSSLIALYSVLAAFSAIFLVLATALDTQSPAASWSEFSQIFPIIVMELISPGANLVEIVNEGKLCTCETPVTKFILLFFNLLHKVVFLAVF